MSDANVLEVLRSAPGSTAYRRLPVPRCWDTTDRPHVALLEAADGKIAFFFLSRPSSEKSRLIVAEPRSAENGTIVEVRHNTLDYRYYRFEKGAWRLVAEVRSHFLMEVYDREEIPLMIRLSDAHAFASE